MPNENEGSSLVKWMGKHIPLSLIAAVFGGILSLVVTKVTLESEDRALHVEITTLRIRVDGCERETSLASKLAESSKSRIDYLERDFGKFESRLNQVASDVTSMRVDVQLTAQKVDNVLRIVEEVSKNSKLNNKNPNP